MFKRLLTLIGFALFSVQLMAQVTTSSMSGTVKSSTDEPLVGATVTATHLPTGTVYRTVTRTGGRFDIVNMDPGGPYTVAVSFIGFGMATRSDITLALGEEYRTDFIIDQ